MGWKNVKEAYNIGHIVQVTDEGICIGSPYIHDLIVIGMDGRIKKHHDGRSNADLARYMQEFDADPEKLKQLVLSEDHFDSSVTVYTYDGGNILEKLCEKPGWPNVTHDGLLMYDNTFSTDRTAIIKRAIREAEAGERIFAEQIEEKKRELREREERLVECQNDLQKLRALEKTGAA